VKMIELIEQKLREALGLRERAGTLAPLERELGHLCKEHKLELREVVERLDREPWLLRRLGGAVTVDETFFLRHPEHFDLLQAEFAALLAKAGSPPVLWSAGCATGEEPFSMAITLFQALGPEALRKVQIIATDINEQALCVARRGTYESWSFRGASESFRTSFFREREATQEFQLIAPIHAAVSFKHLPLEAQLLELAPASIDVIFFRNVAIYLTEAATARVYAGFARVLKEGGLLVLGPADPLPSASELRRTRVRDALVHRKQTRVTRVSARPSRPRGFGATSERPLSVRARRRRTRASTVAPAPAENAELSRAQQLADRGRTDEALSVIDEQIRLLGRSAERLGLRGRIRMAAGDASGGVNDLREALTIDPSQLVLRFHYALGLEASRQHECCRLQLQELLQALRSHPDADTLPDGQTGTSIGSIRKAAHELLRRVE
jgi:chemotaxis protein methyltransferase CheR